MELLNLLTHYRVHATLSCFCFCVSLLSGCSYLGIGQSEFSCSGMKDGVKCLSASEVYALTSQQPSSSVTESHSALELTETARASDTNDLGRPRKMLAPVPEQTLTPSYRTDAKVMRIWIAPWEDTLGDLHQPSYLMTEIESRRWQQGVIIATPSQPNVIPLRQTSTPVTTSEPSSS